MEEIVINVNSPLGVEYKEFIYSIDSLVIGQKICIGEDVYIISGRFDVSDGVRTLLDLTDLYGNPSSCMVVYNGDWFRAN